MCRQYIKGWLKMCTTYLAYSQIWLNLPRHDPRVFLHLPMGDCHFGYKTKISLKKLTHWCQRKTQAQGAKCEWRGRKKGKKMVKCWGTFLLLFPSFGVFWFSSWKFGWFVSLLITTTIIFAKRDLGVHKHTWPLKKDHHPCRPLSLEAQVWCFSAFHFWEPPSSAVLLLSFGVLCFVGRVAALLLLLEF